MQSPFRLEPARPVKRKARPQWRAPESKPLQLTEPNTVELAARPRAIIASFGMVALLGIGAVTALSLEDTAGLQAEAEMKLTSATPAVVTPPPRISGSERSDKATREAPPPDKETTSAKQEPANEAPRQANLSPPLNQPATPKPVPEALVSLPEMTALHHNDPRWARPELAEQLTSQIKARQDAPGGATEITAFADPLTKANIIQAAMERTQSPDEHVITAAIPRLAAERPAPIADDSAANAQPAEAKPARQARIRTAVNLRSGPADEAKVIGVVPTNAVVSLVGCNSWCEIVFNDRRGWIYKGFVK